MTELIRNAWTGWSDFMMAGKLPALLIAVFMFAFLYPHLSREYSNNVKLYGDKEKVLLWYTGIMAALCICPVTASILMIYQTRFYNYEWIWGYVPTTAVLALGGGIVLNLIWRKYYTLRDKIRAALLTLLLAGIVVICGYTGKGNNDTFSEYNRVNRVVTEIINSGISDPCLWAPKEVLMYARDCSADVRLLYGRNMWDNALNAYSYDTYPEKYEEIFQWMENVCDSTETGDYTCIQNAIDSGANVIVLPDTIGEETADYMEECAGKNALKTEGYLIYFLQ